MKREGEGDTQQVVWTGIVLQGRELVCDRGDTNHDDVLCVDDIVDRTSREHRDKEAGSQC